MRFMIMVKATATSESGSMPDESLMAVMGAYHEELAKAGVLLDATGLQPSSKGWRIQYSQGQRRVKVPRVEKEQRVHVSTHTIAGSRSHGGA